MDVTFDIEHRLVNCQERNYEIDYEKYRSHHFLTGIDKKLDRVAHRVYYDFALMDLWLMTMYTTMALTFMKDLKF